MAYVRGAATPKAPVLTVEQVRIRNAKLNIELRSLAEINTSLESKISDAKAELTKAHAELTSTIKKSHAVRIQASHIARAEVSRSKLPEPIHGGREGLERAAAEMEAHISKGLRLSKPRKVPQHGTVRKYDLGCRCDDCRTARREKNQRLRANRKARLKESEQVAA